MPSVRFLTFLSVFLLAALSLAQNVPSVNSKKLAKPPTIDGTINAEEWAEAAVFSGLKDQQSGETAEFGEFWIGYDSEAIYFAARLKDATPSAIRALEYRTNVGLSGDDNVTLILDPSGTLGSYSEFSMNAAGGSNLEIAGGRAIKREWLGDFVTKGRITDTGWEAEARIPWKLMQLPSAGTRNPRFNVQRYSTRTQRESVWAHLGGPTFYYGNLMGVEIPKMPFERKLKLLPYGFLGHEEEEGAILDGGLDFKSSLTESIEFVGTIRPDFRNVEGDILSLDFSYLERLPEDNRPFFQEGAQYYGSLLFAPQRIERLDAGANVYGRLGDKITFGALATTLFGDEVATVGTATYEIDPKRVLRISNTSLSGDLRPDNNATLFRYFERQGSIGYGARYISTDDEVDGTGSGFDAEFAYSKGPISGHVQYFDVGELLQPRLGFLPERDYKGYQFEGGIDKQVEKGSIMEWGIFAATSAFDHQNGEFYRSSDALFGSLTMRDGLDFDFGYEKSGFEKNRDHMYFLSIEKPRRDVYRRVQLDYSWGEFAGEEYKNASLTWLFRPKDKLQFALRHQWVSHFEVSEQTILTTTFDMGNNQSVSGRIVRRDGDFGGYFSWRKSGNAGNEYFLILGDPNSPTFRASLILKVVMPFDLKLRRFQFPLLRIQKLALKRVRSELRRKA